MWTARPVASNTSRANGASSEDVVVITELGGGDDEDGPPRTTGEGSGGAVPVRTGVGPAAAGGDEHDVGEVQGEVLEAGGRITAPKRPPLGGDPALGEAVGGL